MPGPDEPAVIRDREDARLPRRLSVRAVLPDIEH
jgi:hypothetical protein